MRYLFLSMLIISSMLMFSCKNKSDCDAGDSVELIIIGTWELKSEFNPWTGETTYPDEEGYTLTITYNDDNTYELIDSREPDVETGTYTVLNSAVEDCNTDMCMGFFEGSPYSITCDQLIYDSTPVDGPRQVYERK